MESAMHSAMAVWRQAAEAYVDFLKAPMFTVGGLPVPGVILLLIVMLCGNVLYQFLRKGETSKVDDSKTVEARQIVTKTEKDALAAKKRVKAGEEFRKVAKEVSTSPEGQLGGVLGTMKPGMKLLGEANALFDQVAYDPKTKVGEVVGPFESKFGWHLFLIEKRTGVDSVTDKKDQ